MMSFFEFENRLPCKVFTTEEIAATYGEKATRPIPAGYSQRRGVIHRINASGAKPFGVYAVTNGGPRRFVSPHSSVDKADREATRLNEGLSPDDDTVYTTGERMPGERRKHEKETD